MKKASEIEDKINELIPILELAEESYFSMIEDKRGGIEVSLSDFIKIESEYEIINKEMETLKWVLNEE